MSDQDQDATSYPLSWPVGWPRTKSGNRGRAKFGKRVLDPGATWRRSESLTVGDGLARLEGELRRLGARRIVISSNLRRNLDGSGVAVYFRLGTAPRALACDKWASAAENMAAIAGHIEAIRAQGRYGVGTVEQAFAGYAALPPKFDAWAVLGLTRDASKEQALDAHRNLVRLNHPDVVGGSHDAIARINSARDEVLRLIEQR